jgi:hypothetical protein
MGTFDAIDGAHQWVPGCLHGTSASERKLADGECAFIDDDCDSAGHLFGAY